MVVTAAPRVLFDAPRSFEYDDGEDEETNMMEDQELEQYRPGE